MLIISRRPSESFLIGDDIEIFILEAQSDKIKVGINAPKSVIVIRKELQEICQANLEAAGSAGMRDFAEIGAVVKRDI